MAGKKDNWSVKGEGLATRGVKKGKVEMQERQPSSKKCSCGAVHGEASCPMC